MRKLILFVALVPFLAWAQAGPKTGKNGGIGSATSTFAGGEPTGGTYAINGTTGDGTLNKVVVKSANRAIVNMNGTSESIYVNKAALNGEIAYGSYANPITVMGPSFKVSRVEKLAITDCNNTYNNNECNAAIVGASTGHKDDKMQTAGIVGVALGYQEGPNPPDTSLDSVGVQGQGRIVGNGIGVGTGGFFQGIADSPVSRAIGIEVNIKNLTGTDAASNLVDGGGFPNILASCGAGNFPSQWKCGSALQVTYSGRNYKNGVVVTNAVDNNAFVETSNATTGLGLFGTHTNQILGTDFAVTGSGKVWVGLNYNSATPNGITVRQANGNQAVFQSTGSNASTVSIENTTTGQQSRVDFNDAGTNKWQIGKLANNDFYIWDNAGSSTALSIPTAGSTVNLGKGLKFAVTTVAALPTCNSGMNGAAYYVTDANAPTWNATLAAGGSVRALAVCNGTNWTAH